MKNSYDVIVVGAATAGSYFARKLAENGVSVLLIDSKPEEKVGTKYDIFHVGREDFGKFGIPWPVKGEDYAFEFDSTHVCSAFGHYPKFSPGKVVGMHMHDYTLRLNRWAIDGGAEIAYETVFVSCTYENGKITGVKCRNNGEEIEIKAKLVADCSGIPAVVRRSLPETYGVETFEIDPTDMFYVVLRYISFINPDDKMNLRSWPFYKTWEAPQHNPKGAILGIGANLSFDMCEKVYKEFEAAVELTPHKIDYFERGFTPYRRPPYSLVSDSFIALGDAACITKPSCGEGVTAAMVQMDAALEVILPLIKCGKECSRDNLWIINKKYIDVQGADFANQMAVLIGAVASSAEENEYFFANDLIFSTKNFVAMGEGGMPKFSIGEILTMAYRFIKGIVTGKLRISTIIALLKAVMNGGKISGHYKKFPTTPAGFEVWCNKADIIWKKCGKMADMVSDQ